MLRLRKQADLSTRQLISISATNVRTLIPLSDLASKLWDYHVDMRRVFELINNDDFIIHLKITKSSLYSTPKNDATNNPATLVYNPTNLGAPGRTLISSAATWVPGSGSSLVSNVNWHFTYREPGGSTDITTGGLTSTPTAVPFLNTTIANNNTDDQTGAGVLFDDDLDNVILIALNWRSALAAMPTGTPDKRAQILSGVKYAYELSKTNGIGRSIGFDFNNLVFSDLKSYTIAARPLVDQITITWTDSFGNSGTLNLKVKITGYQRVAKITLP
jgi:hypothetical protein